MRLEPMLTNLIDNAIKFNAEKGSVSVSFMQKNGKDYISVTDTGEGISGDHLQRIFERFYRTDRARSREIGGTGLGLAVSQKIIREHGGELLVESKEGAGATFRLVIARLDDESGGSSKTLA